MSRFEWMLATMLVASAAVVGPAQISGAEEARAPGDSVIKRLEPTAFPELPSAVSRDLARRGCQIPQTYLEEKPHNVIRGAFRRPGQTDWAVLCSRNGVSSIIVYWSGSSEGVTQLGATRDEGWLQDIGEGRLGFSRYLATVDRDYILEHYEIYGGPEPPLVDHDGINDAFAEKASVVLYWHEGEWLDLQGAD